MTDERQIAELPTNQLSTKRGFPVYRTNPSVPSTNGLPTRNRRFQVPGGKASMIVDNSTGELKGIGGMGFWWDEEVDTTRFVKLFLDGIKQAAGLSKTGIQVRDGAIPDLGTAKSTVDQFRETSPPPTLCRWRPDWQLKANWHPDFSTKTIL